MNDVVVKVSVLKWQWVCPICHGNDSKRVLVARWRDDLHWRAGDRMQKVEDGALWSAYV